MPNPGSEGDADEGHLQPSVGAEERYGVQGSPGQRARGDSYPESHRTCMGPSSPQQAPISVSQDERGQPTRSPRTGQDHVPCQGGALGTLASAVGSRQPQPRAAPVQPPQAPTASRSLNSVPKRCRECLWKQRNAHRQPGKIHNMSFSQKPPDTRRRKKYHL